MTHNGHFRCFSMEFRGLFLREVENENYWWRLMKTKISMYVQQSEMSSINSNEIYW